MWQGRGTEKGHTALSVCGWARQGSLNIHALCATVQRAGGGGAYGSAWAREVAVVAVGSQREGMGGIWKALEAGLAQGPCWFCWPCLHCWWGV